MALCKFIKLHFTPIAGSRARKRTQRNNNNVGEKKLRRLTVEHANFYCFGVQKCNIKLKVFNKIFTCLFSPWSCCCLWAKVGGGETSEDGKFAKVANIPCCVKCGAVCCGEGSQSDSYPQGKSRLQQFPVRVLLPPRQIVVILKCYEQRSFKVCEKLQ